MKHFKTVALFLLAALLLASCATMGPSTPRTAYIEAEKQWKGLLDDYLAWKQAGMVTEDNQNKIEALFEGSSTVLDLYRAAVLSGGETGDYITQLNNLKRQILLELARMKKGGG